MKITIVILDKAYSGKIMQYLHLIRSLIQAKLLRYSLVPGIDYGGKHLLVERPLMALIVLYREAVLLPLISSIY
jgi:hypothetical protein